MGKLTLPTQTATPAITTLIPAPASESWAPTMQPASAPTDSLLLRQLRLFVAEVLRIIESYDNHRIGSDDETTIARAAAEEVCEKLTREIDTQTMEITRIGTPADRAAVEELRYLKAAIADEFLLSRSWPGQSRFTETLIETRLFGTSVSGDKIFEQIDALLAETSGAPQMAPLYLFAIAIGFEGRYRGDQADHHLQALRDALFRKIYRREPALAPGLASQPANADRVLSAQAYRYPLSNIVPIRFFRFSRGFVTFIGVMLLLLVLSQVLWRVTSAPVRKALEPAAPGHIQQTVPNGSDRG